MRGFLLSEYLPSNYFSFVCWRCPPLSFAYNAFAFVCQCPVSRSRFVALLVPSSFAYLVVLKDCPRSLFSHVQSISLLNYFRFGVLVFTKLCYAYPTSDSRLQWESRGNDTFSKSVWEFHVSIGWLLYYIYSTHSRNNLQLILIFQTCHSV